MTIETDNISDKGSTRRYALAYAGWISSFDRVEEILANTSKKPRNIVTLDNK